MVVDVVDREAQRRNIDLQGRFDVFAQKAESVWSSEIRWVELAQAGLISDSERDLALQLHGARSGAAVAARAAQDAASHAALLGTLLTRVESAEVLRYALLAFGEACDAGGSDAEALRCELARSETCCRGSAVHATLLRLCRHEDPFCAARAMVLLSSVMGAHGPGAGPAGAASELLSVLTSVLKAGSHQHPVATYTAAARSLQAMLRRSEHRAMFFFAARASGKDRVDGTSAAAAVAAGRDVPASEGVPAVVSLLRSNTSSPQLMYHLLYALWLLTFDDDVAARLGPLVIPSLAKMLRRVGKEKVVRLALAILRNLLNRGSNNRDMIILGLIKTVAGLAARKWDDEDIVSDIEALDEALANDAHELSSFETYRKEVISGELEWSPVHRSETFWRENISMFEQNDFQLLRLLVNLLIESHEAKTLAISCHDLGEFVRHHSSGKEIADQLKIKTKVMSFLQHEDAAVRKEALVAVQKMLVSRWELLS